MPPQAVGEPSWLPAGEERTIRMKRRAEELERAAGQYAEQARAALGQLEIPRKDVPPAERRAPRPRVRDRGEDERDLEEHAGREKEREKERKKRDREKRREREKKEKEELKKMREREENLLKRN